MNENLLTKKQSAEFLGISTSTFDRLRQRIALAPALLLKTKPIFFRRSDLAALIPAVDVPAPAPAPAPRGEGRIISVREAKARAGRKGVR